MVFICFAMISGSFATTPKETTLNTYTITKAVDLNDIKQSKNSASIPVKISKKKAREIAVWQLGVKHNPKYATIKVLGVVKIDGKLAWKIKCNYIDKPHKFVYVYVNTRNGDSKKNKKVGYDERGELSWRSLDNIIASEAASCFAQTPYIKKGWKIKLKGKTVWKIPLYDQGTGKPKFKEYIYVNVKERLAGDGKLWFTFKEIGLV